VSAEKFNRTVIALRVALRRVEELRKRFPAAAAVLDGARPQR
jgi:hypothetical protein